MLLKRYLWDLPEPLFALSLKDYRNYKQNRNRYIENDFSLWRSKIRELHPVHRASLGTLLRHLLRVSTHSDKNAMTAEVLAARFRYGVLRGDQVIQDGVRVKTLVLEDLIQNAHILFDERLFQSPPLPSPDVAETTSTHTNGSLFLSPEWPQPAEVMGSSTRHRSSSSFSSSPSVVATESRFTLTPSPTGLLSPLLGLPSSQTLTEGVETNTQEQIVPEAGGAKAVKTSPDSTPSEVMSVPLTSVAEWRLRQSQLSLPHPEPPTIPQSPPESVLSSTSELPLSSATSLRTGIGLSSP
ncbi:hypothetical protein H4582DRAFT_100622 [Lactarius indigo]|nr:hypothetical protein H4582DRAFT_100622 [Lactarius indigo]